MKAGRDYRIRVTFSSGRIRMARKAERRARLDVLIAELDEVIARKERAERRRLGRWLRRL